VSNVIVTGGSRGLGLGIARRLASAGYTVIAIARNQGPQPKAQEEIITGQASGSVHFRSFDLANVAGIRTLVRDLRREFGPIFGLVNNAGLGTSGLLAMTDDTRIEALVQLNVVSPIVLTKYVVRSMMAEGRGRIVNIASIVGFTGYKGLSAYAATKASLIGFTRSLAREVGSLGINVNAIAPGFLDTAMTAGTIPERRDQIARRSPMGRLAEVDDIANAVEFLMGKNGRNITGMTLTIDAGATA
jgi:3-oxoacyl-[acyl-carrier protein] reductase